MKHFNKQILEAVRKGIQLALDDYQDIVPNSSISQTNDIIDVEDVIQDKIDLSQFVDLGLPSRTLWHKGILGETNDTFGYYYAWGELEEKQTYSWKNYKFANKCSENLTKYCNDIFAGDNEFRDDKEILDLCDDVAYLTNPHYKIPTKKDFEELLDNCYYQWIDNDNASGIVYRSKINGNELFFPAAGYINEYGQIIKRQKIGLFWASEITSFDDDIPESPEYAYCLSIEQASNAITTTSRALGLQIKPIWIK